ncbi:MAG: hypothetical protein PVF58_21545 [Candidatus Methanofastidiosia archaeon]|jgi:hypothetical protein
MNMDRIRAVAKRFMEKKYPDEAPYFDIAWDIYKQTIKDGIDDSRDFKGPVVRFEGDDTIMAPAVIGAVSILYNKFEKEIESGSEIPDLKNRMMTLLRGKKFSEEFSKTILDFILENQNV